MACAAFPALIVTIPRSRCSLDSLETAKTAPRGLNEPVRWKFSALRYAAVPMRSDRDRLEKSGVRWRTGVTISRARSTSARVTEIGVLHGGPARDRTWDQQIMSPISSVG